MVVVLNCDRVERTLIEADSAPVPPADELRYREE